MSTFLSDPQAIIGNPRDHLKTNHLWTLDKETLQKINILLRRWRGQKSDTTQESRMEAKENGR